MLICLSLSSVFLGAIHSTKIFRAEVQKFVGGKWIAMCPEGFVPFQSHKEFHAHLMADADHCCSC